MEMGVEVDPVPEGLDGGDDSGDDVLAGKGPDQRYAMAHKGVILLELGASDKAQNLAEELKGFILKGLNKKSIRYYHYLQGQIELKKANYSKAIENFQKAISSLPSQDAINDEHANFFDALALANYKAGNLKEAQREYERITSLTSGRAYYGDIYAKSFNMLGKIFERKKTKAIANYQKFLELWKNADPGFPEVEDARKRLASLKAG
jgi:tetratricopeptide (TPR) repeat protein